MPLRAWLSRRTTAEGFGAIAAVAAGAGLIVVVLVVGLAWTIFR